MVAPYQDGWAFMFRLANERSSQLIEVKATVVLSYLVDGAMGKQTRKFVPLSLERDRVMFFPLHWTVVHPITPESPMAGLNARALADGDAEIFILMTAFDEASSQTVHTRTSYKASEIVFGARYQDIFVGTGERATIDISLLGAVTPV